NWRGKPSRSSNNTSLFFFQAEDGIRDGHVTGVQTCALPISIGARRTVVRAPRAPVGSRSVARTRRVGVRPLRVAVGPLCVGVGPLRATGTLSIVLRTLGIPVGALRVVAVSTLRVAVGPLRAGAGTLAVVIPRTARRLGRLRGSELPRLRWTLTLHLAVSERGPRYGRRRLRRRHDAGRRRTDTVARPRAVGARTFVPRALGSSRVGRAWALSTRRARGDHRARDRVIGRPRRAPARRDKARRVGRHADRRARRLQMARVDLRDARLLNRAAAEMVLANRDDGVV